MRSWSGLLLTTVALLVVMAACGPSSATFVSERMPTPDIAATLTAVTVPSSIPTPDASATPTGASSNALSAYEGCITCHNQHAPTVVEMPHPVNPRCSTCHSGSPQQIGCSSCHSMHAVRAPHASEPDIACATCHQ